MNRRNFLTLATAAAAATLTGLRPVRVRAVGETSEAMTRPLGWGVCIRAQTAPATAAQELAALAPDCYHNYAPVPLATRAGSVFVPMIWSDRWWNRAQVDARMASNPGETWLLWNEPERLDQANQASDLTAALSREFLQRAWATGQEFQWCAPGIGPRTPDFDGLAWSTAYIQNMRRRGISRPSYWHVHSYRSSTLSEFRASMAAWRSWYAAWGSSAPVVLSEVCAQGASLDNQRSVMAEARDMLARGDVCGVMWFVTSGSEWPTAHLCNGNSLTPLGEYWRGLQRRA